MHVDLRRTLRQRWERSVRVSAVPVAHGWVRIQQMSSRPAPSRTVETLVDVKAATWVPGDLAAQARLLRAVADTYPLPRSGEHCIEAARWTVDLLVSLGAPAKATPAYNWVFNQRAVDLLNAGRPVTDDNDAWSIGTVPSGTASGAYPGHMVVTTKAKPRWIIDLSAGQFTRGDVLTVDAYAVMFDDSLPAPAWLKLPQEADPIDSGKVRCADLGNGTHVCWLLHPSDPRLGGWKSTDAWLTAPTEDELQAWRVAIEEALA